MKKIIYWTLSIHATFFGGFFASLLAGLSYKEFDQIKAGMESTAIFINNLKAIIRLFVPWM